MLLAVNLGSKRRRNCLLYNPFSHLGCELTHALLVNLQHGRSKLQLDSTKSSVRKHPHAVR